MQLGILSSLYLYRLQVGSGAGGGICVVRLYILNLKLIFKKVELIYGKGSRVGGLGCTLHSTTVLWNLGQIP